jgi:hypothetical protein
LRPKNVNENLTSELLDQSCRRGGAREREAEIIQDSTWAPHLVHQPLVEDASNHPTDARFSGGTEFSIKKHKYKWPKRTKPTLYLCNQILTSGAPSLDPPK